MVSSFFVPAGIESSNRSCPAEKKFFTGKGAGKFSLLSEAAAYIQYIIYIQQSAQRAERLWGKGGFVTRDSIVYNIVHKKLCIVTEF